MRCNSRLQILCEGWKGLDSGIVMRCKQPAFTSCAGLSRGDSGICMRCSTPWHLGRKGGKTRAGLWLAVALPRAYQFQL